MSYSGDGEGVINYFNIDENYIDRNPYNLQSIYKFDPIFNLNANDLGLTASGIAVHRNKDVVFNFDILDRSSSQLITSNKITENPFVEGIFVDILNKSGELVYENYLSGYSQSSFTFKEIDNINIFGSYNSDFGVRIKISDQSTNLHLNEFYVYGNSLEIDTIKVNDSNGYWSNYDPISYQTYFPYYESGNDINANYVDDSSFYINKYDINIDNYNFNINSSVSFAVSAGESLRIDWGDSNSDLIFKSFGTGSFSGSGVTRDFVPTGDVYLNNTSYSGNIDGYIYDLNIFHNYASGITGIYDINIYYSGDLSTSEQLIKSFKYKIPYELKEQGFTDFKYPSTGQINFEVNFSNSTVYTHYDKIDVYAATYNNFLNTQESFVKTFDVSTNDTIFDFIINEENINPNQNYWFTLVPFSKIKEGLSWDIGPYSIYKPPAPRNSLTTDLLYINNGGERVLSELITGYLSGINYSIIDTIAIDSEYSSYEYLTRFKDSLNFNCSSKLLISDNVSGLDSSRTGLSFSESNITDNNFIDYNIYNDANNIYLQAKFNYTQFTGSPSIITGSYKLYKTSI